MNIIPAIDLIGGKCVRLSKGDYSTQKTYYDNPLDIAFLFQDHGVKYLHVVDLDGAKERRIINYNTLEKLASKTGLTIDFGGGIQSVEDLETAFGCGATQVIVGSIAAKKPELFVEWLQKFGSDKLILGADCLDRKIKTAGWLENTDADVVDFIKKHHKTGAKTVICTDISKDGMLQGPSEELYKEIIAETQVQLIASGGISNAEDVLKMKEIGSYGTIIGKAFYEGKISLEELKKLIEVC